MLPDIVKLYDQAYPAKCWRTFAAATPAARPTQRPGTTPAPKRRSGNRSQTFRRFIICRRPELHSGAFLLLEHVLLPSKMVQSELVCRW